MVKWDLWVEDILVWTTNIGVYSFEKNYLICHLERYNKSMTSVLVEIVVQFDWEVELERSVGLLVKERSKKQRG